MKIHRNILKQKHKPFKSSKSSKVKKNISTHVAQKISPILSRKNKKYQIISKNKKIRLNLHEESPRNVFVLPFNSDINSFEVINAILTFYSANSSPKPGCSKEAWFLSQPILLNQSFTHDGIPRRVVFYTCPRTLRDILYCASASDIILCLFRGASQDTPAFDDLGYKILSCLRLQGIPTPVGVNFESSLPGDRQPSSTLVRRYFHSEFGLDKKFTSVFSEKDLRTVLSLIGCVSTSDLSWRRDRGYMLSLNHSYDFDRKELILEGYAKGLGFTVKHPLHLTSFGDFILKRIDLVPDICPVSSNPSKISVERTVEELNNEDLSLLLSESECLNYVSPQNSNSLNVTDTLQNLNNYITDDNQFHDDFSSKLRINKISAESGVLSEDTEMEQDTYYDYENASDGSVLSDESDFDLDDILETSSNSSKKIEFESRSLEELSFPDEVDTPVDTPAKHRFRKYRSLKNIRTSVWDPYESLPIEYYKINEFENFRVTMSSSKTQLKKNCEITNVSGSFVRLTLVNFSPEDYSTLSSTSRFALVSTILPYERKVSVVNFNVSRTSEGPDLLPSKTPLHLFFGFRRVIVMCYRFPGIPIYSKSINVDRGKRGLYERFFKKGDNCVATIYGLSLCPPTPVLALDQGTKLLLLYTTIIYLRLFSF
ncbi:uncharacterized protein TA19450 [Theileria annulata]|uniref:Uncharacterized protein n=1 Tax=Theileria annulata TaxID=5874 RepID=Q4UFY3_THEAN|nr:uncharacterized protein TA19450 [Theileria annulata]CAI74006.1 hypothetical protein, conserved [Theileria annulata]|eukprot:XP_954686.1 hypothetical protein, conserved [Theileria annulata]